MPPVVLNAPISAQGEFASKRFYGDPKRAVAYLPVAYKLLGELKNQMALSDIGFGHRLCQLADGTKIRVIRNGEMNIVEITPASSPLPTPFLPQLVHGFCFFPKSLKQGNGWVYANRATAPNSTAAHLAYYGSSSTNSFGALTYQITEQTIAKTLVQFGVYYVAGNQFFFYGEDVYSFFHSAGGDLPMPVRMLSDESNQMLANCWFTPILWIGPTYSYAAWKIGDRSISIPNCVYLNGRVIGSFGSCVLGVGIPGESKALFVIHTNNFRNVVVSDMSYNVLYFEQIYTSDERNVAINRKAFVHPDGSRFSIISLHETGSKIHQYTVSYDKENGLSVSKSGVIEYPPATITTLEEQSKSRQGFSHALRHQYGWWKQVDAGQEIWCDGTSDPPPDPMEFSGRGNILDHSSYSINSEEPVAVIYKDGSEQIVTFYYEYAQGENKAYSETNVGKAWSKLFSTGAPPCNSRLWLSQANALGIAQRNDILTTRIFAEFRGCDTPFVVEDRLYETRYYGTAWKFRAPDPAIEGRGSYTETRNEFHAATNNKIIKNYLHYMRFSDLTYFADSANEEHKYHYSYYFYHLWPKDLKQITQSDMTHTIQTHEFKTTLPSESVLYTYTKEEGPTYGAGESWGGGDWSPRHNESFGGEPYHNVTGDTITGSANHLTSYLVCPTGPTAAVFDSRFNQNDAYMYDVLYVPIYDETDTKKYYFHGDSFGGVVSKLPMDTSEVFIHPIGLF